MNIPSCIPAMTLKGVVLFPDAMLPLRIFEDRYKTMLTDVLKGERMFAVIAEREKSPIDNSLDEPPFEVGTVGLVRVSKKNADGTSFVMLQGVKRIRIRSIIDDGPYRLIRADPFDTLVENNANEFRTKIYDALVQNKLLGGDTSDETLEFLKIIDDDITFVDLAAYSLCKNTIRKQAMLEVQRLHKRAEMLFDDLMKENLQLSLYKKNDFWEDAPDLDRN